MSGALKSCYINVDKLLITGAVCAIGIGFMISCAGKARGSNKRIFDVICDDTRTFVRSLKGE